MPGSLVLRESRVVAPPVEIVERKGIGHPDTICDALAENLSRALCRWYVEHTGTVLHHNVDKALLRGGAARAGLGGGEVIEPMEIYLAGRATTGIGGIDVPLTELAVEGSRQWLRDHLHALDADRHVRIHCLVRPGSVDLTDLFARGGTGTVPRANDTSFGVGYAPDTALENAVLSAGRILDGGTGFVRSPAWGEDTKIMAIRDGDKVGLSIACAMIAAHVADAGDYQRECRTISDVIKNDFGRQGFSDTDIAVNAADDVERGIYYLTVTGTSAESGDDGQVGRGNRASGLITPNRPMSLEAVCGKNPVNHVGKLYNVAAREIAHRLIEECDMIETAQCCLVSRIGRAITDPSIIDIAVSTVDGSPPGEHQTAVRDIASGVLSRLPRQLDRFMNGDIQLY